MSPITANVNPFVAIIVAAAVPLPLVEPGGQLLAQWRGLGHLRRNGIVGVAKELIGTMLLRTRPAPTPQTTSLSASRLTNARRKRDSTTFGLPFFLQAYWKSLLSFGTLSCRHADASSSWVRLVVLGPSRRVSRFGVSDGKAGTSQRCLSTLWYLPTRGPIARGADSRVFPLRWLIRPCVTRGWRAVRRHSRRYSGPRSCSSPHPRGSWARCVDWDDLQHRIGLLGGCHRTRNLVHQTTWIAAADT